MIAALITGYLLGSVPSADGISRLRGHDLRTAGSGNPGTANALRVAGRLTAGLVLALDITKGVGAFVLGGVLAGPAGSLAAGFMAIAGQVFNPWFGFEGGKGLGVTAGVTAAAWPPGLLLVIPFAALAAALWRAAYGAIVGLAAYLAGAMLWATRDWSTWWGVAPDDRLVWMAIGVIALTAPKFIDDLRGSRSVA